jgi:hypothetical protein
VKFFKKHRHIFYKRDSVTIFVCLPITLTAHSYAARKTFPRHRVINIAKVLHITIGYLLGENEDADVFKDPVMLNRLKAINELPEKDKECILYTLDGLLQNYKAKS